MNIRDIGMGFGISLPGEPLIMLLLGVFILKLLLEGSFDRKIIMHPISILILLHLLWIGITAVSSSMPSVSFKFLLSRLWFVGVFYFMATQIFANKEKRKPFLLAYIWTLAIVILYTTWKHSHYGFDEKIAHWIMDPFFNDHTAYAAAIAMFELLFACTFSFGYCAFVYTGSMGQLGRCRWNDDALSSANKIPNSPIGWRYPPFALSRFSNTDFLKARAQQARFVQRLLTSSAIHL